MRSARSCFKGTGARARNDGDFDAARAAAAQVVEASYRVPFVSHAPLEPQNAFVDVRKDSVLRGRPDADAGRRFASRVRNSPASIARRSKCDMTRVGGGFGRRLTNDFIAEAVHGLEADRQADQAASGRAKRTCATTSSGRSAIII